MRLGRNGDGSYRTSARVSMPVLNPFAGFNWSFDDHRLMSNHNDFAGMVEEIEVAAGEPRYYFFNLGETHVPYMLKDDALPVISGVHGVVTGMDAAIARSGDSTAQEEPEFFSAEDMRALHEQQVRCVEYVDETLGALIERAPAGTRFIITADHGEYFGKGDYFRHGPVMNRREVPSLESRNP